ncbi:MAG TPA: serine hydrolase [Blastococcus sp.]|jgi:D-alanyl-D-alanine carboxypeptidase (penicillin-binding protein 5/6)
MGRGGSAGRLLAGALVAVALVLPATAAGAEGARPTADPGAPTPTAPHSGGPPLGHAPDGRTVGGDRLDTRGIVTAEDAPALPDGIAAAGWLVADAGTGAVLAARDPHGRYYPASTLKTLTLLTLAPRLDPAEVVAGTAEDENIEGSRVGLVVGGHYPVAQLFQALMLQSGNDAANALARAAGGVESTVAAMNETAEAIGAYDTVAGTPSGLDVAGQTSSPYDLALIFRRLLADPATAAVLTTPTAEMPPVPGRSPGYQIQNQNPLLHTYPGNLGGKTGFTDAARHTFVTAAERTGRRLVVSVMGTENVPLRAADQAALLLDWGFTVPPGIDGVGTLVTSGSPAPMASTSQRPARSSDPAPEVTTAGPATTSRLVPAALAGTALLVVAATVIGRRRAVRPVPPQSPRPGEPPLRRPPARRPPVAEEPPRSGEGSTSTPP